MLLGVVFLSALDALLPHLRRDRTWQDASWRQTTLLMTAITPVSYTHLDVYKRQSLD